MRILSLLTPEEGFLDNVSSPWQKMVLIFYVGGSHIAPSTMGNISEEDWRVRSKPTVCFGRFHLVRIPGLGKLTRMACAEGPREGAQSEAGKLSLPYT